MANMTLSTHLTNVVTVFAFLLPIEGHLTWHAIPTLYKNICSEGQEALLQAAFPLAAASSPWLDPSQKDRMVLKVRTKKKRRRKVSLE